MATEEYANVATTTVSSGGTDAPASGTSESWTVASSTPFPAASTGSVQFHVADPAASSEMMLVTNISGTTWTVTRGAESTTPVAHTAGFTVWLVVTAGDLTALATSASVTAAVATETSRAEAAEATKGPILTQATVQTGNANALANTIVPTNTTSGSLTITLPNAPAAGTIVVVKMVIQAEQQGQFSSQQQCQSWEDNTLTPVVQGYQH